MDVQEVVGGDSAPGVGVALMQPVLEHALLSPDLLMGPLGGAPALAEQSAHVYKLFMPRLCSQLVVTNECQVPVCCVGHEVARDTGTTGATTLEPPVSSPHTKENVKEGETGVSTTYRFQI